MSKCYFKFLKNTVVILTPTAHFEYPSAQTWVCWCANKVWLDAHVWRKTTGRNLVSHRHSYRKLKHDVRIGLNVFYGERAAKWVILPVLNKWTCRQRRQSCDAASARRNPTHLCLSRQHFRTPANTIIKSARFHRHSHRWVRAIQLPIYRSDLHFDPACPFVLPSGQVVPAEPRTKARAPVKSNFTLN